MNLRGSCLVLCLLGLPACGKLLARLEQKPAPAGSAEAAHGDGAAPKERAKGNEPAKYSLPFAWETSEDEPLAKTRRFLRELDADNAENVKRGASVFAAFAQTQTPRATVLTCADSRVHTQAWDATPENDEFLVRNIGNQVKNAQGSIEYGVEHLHTPLLLIMGHTGCGAVKAAMGDKSKLSEAIKAELDSLEVPKPKSGQSEDQAWANAVTANVNAQVAAAIEEFASRIQTGELTVVGAVYDFRNDLGGGAGRVHIVNVNANTEPERLKAFSQAVMNVALGSDTTSQKAAAMPSTPEQSALSRLAPLLNRPGVSVPSASSAGPAKHPAPPSVAASGPLTEAVPVSAHKSH